MKQEAEKKLFGLSFVALFFYIIASETSLIIYLVYAAFLIFFAVENKCRYNEYSLLTAMNLMLPALLYIIPFVSPMLIIPVGVLQFFWFSVLAPLIFYNVYLSKIETKIDSFSKKVLVLSNITFFLAMLTIIVIGDRCILGIDKLVLIFTILLFVFLLYLTYFKEKSNIYLLYSYFITISSFFILIIPYSIFGSWC